jgi:hypothetical protein
MDGIKVHNGVEIIDLDYVGIGGLMPGDVDRTKNHASTIIYTEDNAFGALLPGVYIAEER